MTRVLLFGTHPHCFNGYCVVVYNLAKQLAKCDDIELSIFGFQNFYNNPLHIQERSLPDNVFVYDANANENPRSMGFGFDQVTEFVTMNKPDVCVVYNDMVVVSNVLEKLKAIPDRKFKIVVYIDQVYLYQKPEFVKKLNEEVDYVLCFTPYWEETAKSFGITKPTGYLQHGFDPMKHYPVPKKLARQYFGLKKEDFVVLNLNRNQPRKRWDTCLQAFAEFVSRHTEEPVKLLVATALTGAWNLLEVYERELKKRGLTLQDGMKHLILIDNPQQLSDEDINILYNVADVGINTCDGEGFGLCNFEQAAIGTPQIVPKIGGFLDFFSAERAIMVEPKFTLYIDASRDGVGGESQICDWRDFADALDLYYANEDMRKDHGKNCREYILKNYRWDDLGAKFRKILKEVHGVEKEQAKKDITTANINLNNISLEILKELESKEKKPIPVVEVDSEDDKDDTAAVKAPFDTEKLKAKKKNLKRHTQRPVDDAKPAVKVEEGLDKQSLLELKTKIDKLLAAL
jgi:glycosyltransferase involved in cell wall biosynthesis